MEIMVYYNTSELLAIEPRKRMFMTISGSLKNYLKYLLDEVNVEHYAMSHLIEDIVFHVVSDEERLKCFVKETYEFEEGEEVQILPPPPEVVKYVNSLVGLPYKHIKVEESEEKEATENDKIKNEQESKSP